jgi:hypothetical protein
MPAKESLVRCLPLLVSLGAPPFGCDDTGPRVYTAQAYEPEGGCVEDYVPVGLVQADGLFATCDPVCLQIGAVLYVSLVCPPYPATATLVSPEDSQECQAALTAAMDGSSCDTPPDAATEGGDDGDP